jgi:hypothetical protein
MNYSLAVCALLTSISLGVESQAQESVPRATVVTPSQVKAEVKAEIKAEVKAEVKAESQSEKTGEVSPDQPNPSKPAARVPLRKPMTKRVKRIRTTSQKTKAGKKRNRRGVKRRKKRRYPTNRPKRALKIAPELGKIPFPLGEQLTFKVNMLKAHAGTVVFQVGKRGTFRDQSVVELNAFIRSSPFLENFYPIRDALHVLVEERRFLPLKSDFYLKEKNRDVEYSSEFLPESAQIKWEKSRVVKGKKRRSSVTYKTPGVIYNVLSSLYALRRLPLAIGLSFEQYIWDGQRERLIHAEVVGEESIFTDVGRFDAFKIKVTGHITGGIVSKRTLKQPPQEGTVWIGKDAHRTPLKAITPTKLGEASAVLSGRVVNPE